MPPSDAMRFGTPGPLRQGRYARAATPGPLRQGRYARAATPRVPGDCILRPPANAAMLRRNPALPHGSRADADRIVDLEHAERTQDQRRARRNGPALYGKASQHLERRAVQARIPENKP